MPVAERLVFRPAAAADAAPLASMNRHLIVDEGHRNAMTEAQLAARMQGWLSDDYRAVIFERDGSPVGYALYRFDDDHVYLRQFYIERAHRRGGLGRAAIDWLRSNAWPATKRVRLDVLIGNAAGIAFWRAAGFKDYCLTMELDAALAGGGADS